MKIVGNSFLRRNYVSGFKYVTGVAREDEYDSLRECIGKCRNEKRFIKVDSSYGWNSLGFRDVGYRNEGLRSLFLKCEIRSLILIIYPIGIKYRVGQVYLP